ncbi:MAG: hypothetical protein K9I68_02280 [Bacteroidales bacterium]|nr:hypothetical protein [Bacteroidales bacterium]MCF8336482.1 hypothetical protein [Bacteroidales bacterium]
MMPTRPEVAAHLIFIIITRRSLDLFSGFPHSPPKKLEGQAHNLPALGVGRVGRREMEGFYEIPPSDTPLSLRISGRKDPFDGDTKEKGPRGHHRFISTAAARPFFPSCPHNQVIPNESRSDS